MFWKILFLFFAFQLFLFSSVFPLSAFLLQWRAEVFELRRFKRCPVVWLGNPLSTSFRHVRADTVPYYYCHHSDSLRWALRVFHRFTSKGKRAGGCLFLCNDSFTVLKEREKEEIGAMLLFFMLLKSAILCDLYLLTYIICAIETPCDANLFLPFVSIHFFNSRCYF